MISDSHQYRIDHYETLSSLSLKNLNANLSGTYVCRCKNEFGSDSTWTQLFVKGFMFQNYICLHYIYNTLSIRNNWESLVAVMRQKVALLCLQIVFLFYVFWCFDEAIHYYILLSLVIAFFLLFYFLKLKLSYMTSLLLLFGACLMHQVLSGTKVIPKLRFNKFT